MHFKEKFTHYVHKQTNNKYITNGHGTHSDRNRSSDEIAGSNKLQDKLCYSFDELHA